jgi:hypothetical protein
MTYIRHRQRMIQESIFEDLNNTLIACRWKDGTTTRSVVNPLNGNLEVVTTAPDDVFPMMRKGAVKIMDAFPDEAAATDPNTLAMDYGLAGESDYREMGNSGAREQPYTFSMGLLVESDSVASAILSDLRDRYEGRIVAPDAIAIYDYLTDPNVIAAYLDVEYFRWTPMIAESTKDTRLFSAELVVTDYIDATAPV